MTQKDNIKIFVTRKLPDTLCKELQSCYPGLQLICTDTDTPLCENEFLEWIVDEEPDGIVITLAEKCTPYVVRRLPESVKVISTIAVGTDNIDSNACKEMGITVYNTPDLLTEATADLTWALILAASRRVIEGHNMCVNNQFEGWSPTLLMGKELNGATLGIVGLGRIGKAVARRAYGFGMNVIYNNRKPMGKDGDAYFTNLNLNIPAYASADDLCRLSDVISLHCPLNNESLRLFDEARLLSCKKDAVLVNMARGTVIDEDALVKTLKDGHFMGVGLDVYEKEPEIHQGLKEIDRAVLLPHIGSATTVTRWKMMSSAVSVVVKHFEK